MPEVVTLTFNTSRLSIPAQKLMKAAVLYAAKEQQSKLHVISIDDFCGLANLPKQNQLDFTNLLKEASNAIATSETVDTMLPERDDLPFACWVVFEFVAIDEMNFSFKITPQTLDKVLIENLYALVL